MLTGHNLTRNQRALIKKMEAFSFWSELAGEINRHFLVNRYGDLYVFFLFFSIEQELSLCKINIYQFSLQNKKHSSET